ncbi:hypothetical protein V493_05547 [Pseudogymnoascus sp. VKM F-4281 (FW-2241)]|nr:hypothetical protein V493_05547 [Pseudogymnoascus sp. VKM F-4281 (FW-2241)]
MKSSIFSFLATALFLTADATANLTLLAARHVIHSYPGLTPPASLLSLTRQGKVGGIILFGENVDANLPDVVASFQTAYAQSPAYDGIPLLIVTDQEGGQVRRLPGGPESSAKEIGESADPAAAATQAGKDAASALKAYGTNGNLAPVLDVFRKSGDFTDAFERSFGNTSELVSECASAFITAQQAAGVFAAAKHFPGLGSAAKDANTDLKPVTITLTLDELRTVDEAPYKGAIAAGVDMVMASWAVYPALDAKLPAGLSIPWVQGELRQTLGFKGVTITDAIEAGSLKAFGNDAQRGVLASMAGMDIILASGRNATQGEAVVNALVAALEDGELSPYEFSKGTERILAMRKKLVV